VAVGEAIKESFGALVQVLSEAYEGHDERRRVEMAAAGPRGHLYPFDVEEDDEKFTFFTKPC
jgi:hypothetical protein